MEFKVGDIIRGKENNGYGFTNEKMTRAKVLQTRYDNMEIEYLEGELDFVGRTVWVNNSKRKFELANAKPTKQELLDMPIGAKITIDTGEVFVKDGEKQLESPGHVLNINDISEDLTIDEFFGYKIVKVETPTYSTIYEKQEAKEMTLKEIEKQLGYKIKIKGE